MPFEYGEWLYQSKAGLQQDLICWST